MKVVGTAEPFHRICAPYTNCEPFTVTVVVPSEKAVGVTDFKAGIGFNTPIATAPGGSLGNLAVVLVMATVFGTGTIAGAVYRPLLSMVPNSAVPALDSIDKEDDRHPGCPGIVFQLHLLIHAECADRRRDSGIERRVSDDEISAATQERNHSCQKCERQREAQRVQAYRFCLHLGSWSEWKSRALQNLCREPAVSSQSRYHCERSNSGGCLANENLFNIRGRGLTANLQWQCSAELLDCNLHGAFAVLRGDQISVDCTRYPGESMGLSGSSQK